LKHRGAITQEVQYGEDTNDKNDANGCQYEDFCPGLPPFLKLAFAPARQVRRNFLLLHALLPARHIPDSAFYQ
jgi:hypothetical protein